VTAGGSFTKTGWTIGAGGEAALWSNSIARAEYRYANFGTASFNAAQRLEAIGQPIIIDQFGTYTVKVQTHTALFGIAYKFGNYSSLNWI
jgi:outer membrane immunogenic protein